MHRTRCFVGIPLESPASEAVAELLRSLHHLQSVRWVRPENLHLTVKFLGDVDDRDLPEACQSLRTACEEIEPFLIDLQEVGTFPRSGIPRVVWLGIRSEVDALMVMHQRLDQSLESLGVRREGRAYRPHLTLGRSRANVDIEALQQLLATIHSQPLASMEVNQVQLIASFIGRAGPEYQVVDSVSLA